MCACLEKSGGLSVDGDERGNEGREYPDAAWRPRPRLPPVTTTTFPFKEKMFGKSLSSVS